MNYLVQLIVANQCIFEQEIRPIGELFATISYSLLAKNNLMRKTLLILTLFLSANLFAQKIDTVYTEKNGALETLYFTLIPEQLSKGLLVVLGEFSYPQ